MTDYYHKKTGGHGNHRGGPHPGRLPKSVGTNQRKLANAIDAVPLYPNGKRKQGRTLANAISYNAHIDAQAHGNPMMMAQAGSMHVVATRNGGRRAPLVAGPRRARRPR